MLFIFISIDPAHPIKVTWDQACSFFCCCAGLERELRPPSPWHDISLEPWMHESFSSNDLSKKLLLKIAFLWARAEPQRIKTAYGFKRLNNSWFCRVVCRQVADPARMKKQMVRRAVHLPAFIISEALQIVDHWPKCGLDT